MNHTDALTKLAQLEKETKELRAILEKPESAGSLLTKPVPGKHEPFWFLSESDDGLLLLPHEGQSSTSSKEFYKVGNIFQSEAIAQAYAEAIDTMLLLRHQDGTEEITAKIQYVIEPNDSIHGVYIENWLTTWCKLRLISPCFVTEEAAQSAIATIGAERILRMFKTFHGIYE